MFRKGRRPDRSGTDPVRSINVAADEVQRLRDRAESEGVSSISFVVTTLGEGYADHKINVTNLNLPIPRKPMQSLSVRVSDDLWGRIDKHAAEDGFYVSAAVAMLVRGYAHGQLSLPEIRIVYPT